MAWELYIQIVMKTTQTDVVYYFKSGSWHAADPFCPVSLGGVGGNVAALVERLTRMGYHAVPGRISIGAPEGAPEGCQDKCCSWRK